MLYWVQTGWKTLHLLWDCQSQLSFMYVSKVSGAVLARLLCSTVQSNSKDYFKFVGWYQKLFPSLVLQKPN